MTGKEGATFPALDVVRSQYQTLHDGDVVRVVIPDVGIDAPYRVVVEPDETRPGEFSYTLAPMLD